MKTYLAVFTGSPAGMEDWSSMDAALRASKEKAGMDAWTAWLATNQSAIVDQGNPLGKTKRIAGNGITDMRNNLAAYCLVRAESHEAAARLFERHPHFTIFPGDGIEVMECLPLPRK